MNTGLPYPLVNSVTAALWVAILPLAAALIGPTAACFATEAETRPDPVLDRFDEQVGLWRGSTTRGPDGHDIRVSAMRLVRAGLHDRLDDVPVERVLTNIRAAQQQSGRLRGGFWWAWQDERITDHNSAFFTVIQLLALHHAFGEQLGDEARRTLDDIFADAYHWFRFKVYPITDDKLRYPNAYLGDAVCLWLLAEMHERVSDELNRDMARILAYYRDHNWGWGEHLSDLYAKICQRILVSLLMWSRDLPLDLTEQAEGLMRELAWIDGAFAGGPRVPTIRCHFLDRSPRTPDRSPLWFRPYDELMVDPPVGEFTIATLARRRGLHERFATPDREGTEVRIGCHGGAEALAWVGRRWRMGVMTRYPLDVDINDQAAYGLHWQSMPVAFWHVKGDWGFLQWVTQEEGRDRAMPAFSRGDGRSRRLSEHDRAAMVGQTFGHRHGRELLALRRLPAVSARWPWAADRLRLVDATTSDMAVDRVNGWHRLVLRYGEETVTIACHAVRGEGEVALEDRGEGEHRFGVRWDLADERPASLSNLWYLTIADGPAAPPRITMDGKRIKAQLADGTTLSIEAGERPAGKE